MATSKDKPVRMFIDAVGEADSYLVLTPHTGGFSLKLADCSQMIDWWFPRSPRGRRKIAKVKAVVDRIYEELHAK